MGKKEVFFGLQKKIKKFFKKGLTKENLFAIILAVAERCTESRRGMGA